LYDPSKTHEDEHFAKKENLNLSWIKI